MTIKNIHSTINNYFKKCVKYSHYYDDNDYIIYINANNDLINNLTQSNLSSFNPHQ